MHDALKIDTNISVGMGLVDTMKNKRTLDGEPWLGCASSGEQLPSAKTKVDLCDFGICGCCLEYIVVGDNFKT